MQTPKTITSLQNERIKSVTALHLAKYRDAQQQFIAEGIRVIKTLLETSIKLEQLYLLDYAAIEPIRTLVDDEKIFIVSPEVMKKISTTTAPSGILGVFAMPPACTSEELTDGIVLAEIADPGNMGTLMRTAAAMGKKSMVLVGGVDPWNPKVIQASAGTIGLLSLFMLSWEQLLAAAKQQNLNLIALVVKGGKDPATLSFKNSLLVIGSEAHGLPESWIASCADTMTIPMPGHTESLNAAIAGSIAMYLATQKKS